MFADTDFILAIIKDSDWLKENAKKILKENKGQIRTSVSVMIEIALLCKRFEMDVLKVFVNIFEIIKVDKEVYGICLRAALYMHKHKVNVFDAFHASFCDEDIIISSDSVYDKLEIERLDLM